MDSKQPVFLTINSHDPSGGMANERRDTSRASIVNTAAVIAPTCSTSLALGIAPPSNHGRMQTVATATRSELHSRANDRPRDDSAPGFSEVLAENGRT